MSITTKTGDTGTTSFFGGKRISKADISIEAYGSVDELSSFLGFIHAKLDSEREKTFITDIQKDLYQIMASLAGDKRVDVSKLNKRLELFEKQIDYLENKLPKLTSFLLPQGGEVASLFHISRTVCRRAERQVIRYYSSTLQVAGYKLHVIQYLNRLSDLLFMLARKYSLEERKVEHN